MLMKFGRDANIEIGTCMKSTSHKPMNYVFCIVKINILIIWPLTFDSERI